MALPEVLRIENGAYRENAWVAFCGGAEAVVVDPGDEAGRILEAVSKSRAAVREVLLTHGHVDHMSALGEILAAFPGAKLRISPADEEWCFSADWNAMPPYAVPARPARSRIASVADGDSFRVGDVAFRVVSTPGHSPGSVCYLAESGGQERPDALFSGDTLFAGSIGRTDFPGGDDAAMRASLDRLAALAPDTVVLPGHGPATTIAREIASNPFLRHDY